HSGLPLDRNGTPEVAAGYNGTTRANLGKSAGEWGPGPAVTMVKTPALNPALRIQTTGVDCSHRHTDLRELARRHLYNTNSPKGAAPTRDRAAAGWHGSDRARIGVKVGAATVPPSRAYRDEPPGRRPRFSKAIVSPADDPGRVCQSTF